MRLLGPEQEAEECERQSGGQAKADTEQSEPFPRPRRPLPHPAERPLDATASAAREEHGDQAKEGACDRLSAHRLRQVDVPQPRGVESNRNRRQREHREQDREPSPVVADPGCAIA